MWSRFWKGLTSKMPYDASFDLCLYFTYELVCSGKASESTRARWGCSQSGEPGQGQHRCRGMERAPQSGECLGKQADGQGVSLHIQPLAPLLSSVTPPTPTQPLLSGCHRKPHPIFPRSNLQATDLLVSCHHGH